MTFIDIVILVVVVGVMFLISYFHIWKNRNEPCKGCSYAKKCNGCCNNTNKKLSHKKSR